jgi:hypothetical protein
VLAPYVTPEAIETLIEEAAAETSWLGIVLTGWHARDLPVAGPDKNSGSAKSSARARPTARAPKTFCARSSPLRCW